MTRNVLRLRVKKFDPAMKSEYFVRVTANRAGLLGAMSYTKLKRPTKDGVTSEEENAVSLDGENGEMVVTGTAPIIAVKKSTVASDGTTFAIEADPSGWWLSIIAADPAHPVRVRLNPGTSPPREFTETKCWFFDKDETNPMNAVEVKDAACDSLKLYANTLLNRSK